MFLIAQDLKRLVNVSLHLGSPLNDAELQALLANIDASAEALAKAGPDAFFTTLVVVATEHALNAAQRKANRRRKRVPEESGALPRSEATEPSL
jgi:hypothetical protein